MEIREAKKEDFDRIWIIFREVVSAGETYPYPRNTNKIEAKEIWLQQPHKTFVVEDDNKIIGTYYIKKNQPGLGSHVCNCGYMVLAEARGNNIGTKMCEHSQKIARELGYKAMQFNLVVSTNTVAVHLWQKLGFKAIGKLPKAFNHPKFGYVDALVLYKLL